MNSLMNTLKCGIVSEHSKDVTLLTVSRFKDIYNEIIPLFNEYKIGGIKALDFKDFCIVAELVNKKAHLTLAGLKEIREIKRNMNKGRHIC
jgi:hypothetical protein